MSDARAGLQGFAYEELVMGDGTLTLEADFSDMALVGPRVQLDINGWARLPLAHTEGGCDVCPSNQTLWATGEIALHDLRYVEEGTLRADFSGNLTAARLDETAVTANLGSVAAVATGAAVGALAAAFVGKLLWGALVTRNAKDPLSHPRRKALYDHIVAAPGITFRALVRQTGIPVGTTAHHLAVLKRSGILMERPHRATRRFFQNHGAFEQDWSWVVFLREPHFAQLYDEVAHTGASPQKVILQRMARHGWSRSTTQHRLDRLASGGLVTVQLQGRFKVYRAAPRPRSASPPIHTTVGRPPPASLNQG